MNGLETVGKYMLVAGGVLALLGGVVWLLSRLGILGHLPGDVRIERPGFSCFVPIVSSIVLSILLTIVVNIVIRLLNR